MQKSGKTSLTGFGKATCEVLWLEQGDIILVRFPFSNLIDYKIRPAIIVSNNSFNKHFNFWACPITSKETGHCIPLKESLIEGTLKQESFANTTAITTIEKELVLKKIGKLSAEKTKKIAEALARNLKTVA